MRDAAPGIPLVAACVAGIVFGGLVATVVLAVIAGLVLVTIGTYL